MADVAKERILVIIPAHNEEGRIGEVVRCVRAVLPAADVSVISDDSSDATLEEALAAGARVLPHPVNLGYGAALETGYLFAVRHGYDAVLQMDGDGQHLAEELPRILAPVLGGHADLVLGSRYLSGDTSGGTSGLKRLFQRFFAAILRGLTHQRFTDPTSGFQALGPRALKLFASGVFPCDYPDADVLLMSFRAGLRIMEVPVRMKLRRGGVSMHSGLKPVYYVMKMLLALLVVLLNWAQWRRWRHRFAGLDPAAQGK